jgi:hypothetical protein
MRESPHKPPRFEEMKTWLLDELDDDERLYVRRWIARYVNRWGQVPVASSRRASVAYEKLTK